MNPTSDLLKETFLKKVIESMQSGKPVDLDIFRPHLQSNNDFLLYADEVQVMQKVISEIYENSQKDFDVVTKYILFHLKALKEDRRKDAYYILKEMFSRLYLPALSLFLKDKFNRGIEFLEKRVSYFCSYTTKGLPEINHTYIPMLSTAFTIDKDRDRDKLSTTNYVAKLIVRYFNDHGFRHFFDEDNIVNGDSIADKVYTYCENTIVLVILAQQETFRDQDNETNWCYLEYNHYKETHPEAERKFIVYKIPDLAKPVNARKPIKEWFDFVSTTAGISSTAIGYDWPTYRLRNVINKDAETILRTSEKLFDDLANSEMNSF